MFGIQVYPWGNFTIPLYVSIVAYAILKHQLLDIQVIVKRTLVFAGLVASVVGVVSLVAFVTQDVLIQFVQIPRWLSNVLAAGIIAGLYGPLRNRLTNATERYLFQKKYDYKELLRKFTDEVMVMVDLKQLLQMTVKTLSETVKLDGCSLLLLNKDTREYELAAANGANGRALEVHPEHQGADREIGMSPHRGVVQGTTPLGGVGLHEQEPFIAFLRKTHEPIGRDGQLGKVRFPDSVTDRLKQLNARLCLPLAVHDELIGVLCLGKKKSDEEFTKDDLDILLPLARTLAIAIANSQLLSQRMQFLAELRKEDQLKAVATLAAGMAHEIKNPLAAIKTFVTYLPEKAGDPVFQQKFQRIVTQEVDKIDHIVRRLLDFAKPTPPRLERLRVSRLLEETLDFLSGDCLKRRVEVERAYSPQDTIQGDPQQLRQVFLNLFTNSLDAMERGGKLSVRTSSHEGQIRVTIRDTGQGIPPDQAGHIFEPFFTTKPHGTGLGLAVVHGIVTEHGGRISVESAVGTGTTFFLDFPTVAPMLPAVTLP